MVHENKIDLPAVIYTAIDYKTNIIIIILGTVFNLNKTILYETYKNIIFFVQLPSKLLAVRKLFLTVKVSNYFDSFNRIIIIHNINKIGCSKLRKWTHTTIIMYREMMAGKGKHCVNFYLVEWQLMEEKISKYRYNYLYLQSECD